MSAFESEGSAEVLFGSDGPGEAGRVLCEWFASCRRELPWRTDPTPYHVWVSEIMLQQTRVEAVKPYYERFIRELPDIRALADCPEDRLHKLWEGLGYYSRVRNMQRCARVLTEEYGSALPADYTKLLSLPGIGPYTAGAIASIAFGIGVPAVDGNVLRVVARLRADRRDIRQEAVKRDVFQTLQPLLESGTGEWPEPGRKDPLPEREQKNALTERDGVRNPACTDRNYGSADRREERNVPGTINQALMEIGALVCVPGGAPHCEKCPLSRWCVSHKNGLTDSIPFRSAPKKRKMEEKTILVLLDGTHTLIRRREEKGLLAGMYELPSLSGHRTPEEVLTCMKQEMGLEPVRIQPLPAAKHVFSHIEWQMTGYRILVTSLGEVNPEAGFLVVRPEETEKQYPIPAAFRVYARALSIRLGKAGFAEEESGGKDRD